MRTALLCTLIAMTAAGPLTCAAQASEKDLENIRLWYAETGRSLSSCILYDDPQWRMAEDPAGYYAEIKGYFDPDADNFTKVEERGWTDSSRIHIEYYLRDGELFFIKISGHEPSASKAGGSPSFRQYEERIYVAFGETIKFLYKESKTPSLEARADLDRIGNFVGDPREPELLRLINRVTAIRSTLK